MSVSDLSDTSQENEDGDIHQDTVFMPQDEEKELAALTISELIEVQADLIGITSGLSGLQLVGDINRLSTTATFTAFSASTTSQSIPIAIARLNHEISKLPAAQTNSYYRAVLVCPRLVDHERKLMFLEHENFDSTLAAKRIAKYWNARLEVFGPDRCFLPMTLTGAMRGEAVNATNHRIMQRLPGTDTSGRAVLFFCPYRRALAEYSAEQEAMFAFYLLETVMEYADMRRRGIVLLIDARDYHSKHECWRFTVLLQNIFDSIPMHRRACHICHPSKVFYFLIFPVMKRFVRKSSRLRLRVHDGSTSRVLMNLAGYGLPRDRLPTEVGGSVILDMKQWIVNRLELESARERIVPPVPNQYRAVPSTTMTLMCTTAINTSNSTTSEGLQNSTMDTSTPTCTSRLTSAAPANSSHSKNQDNKIGAGTGHSKGRSRGKPSDPRMSKAIEIKQANPELSLYDALVAGGFLFRQDSVLNDMVDTDGITLRQRKNNLCRRIRLEKTKKEKKRNTSEEGKEEGGEKKNGERENVAADALLGLTGIHNQK